MAPLGKDAVLVRRIAVGFAAAVMGFGGLAVAVAAPASADPPPDSLANDYVPPSLPPPPSAADAAPAPALGAGFATFDAGTGWTFRDQKAYTLRLVSNSQGNVETMRAAAQTAASQVSSISGVSITVASGTVSDTSPDRMPSEDEILLSIDSSSGCTGSWAGCGAPLHVDTSNDVGVATIQAGRIWIHPTVVSYTTTDRGHVIAHELGHTLGLAHFNSSYGGSLQVMNGTADGYAAGVSYKSGDQNGLRFLKPTPCAATYKTPTRAFVRAGYTDFWGRVPTGSELDLWTAGLTSGSLCRHDLIDFLADGDLYLGSLVDQGFQEVFDRSADPSGKSFWIGKLRSGEYTVGRFHAYIYSSNEFWVDAGSTNGGFIDRLYQRLYGRNPDSGGRAYWIGKLEDGTSRYSVASSIYASNESRGDRVDRVSSQILQRALDSSGRAYWVGVLGGNGGDDIDITKQMALSSEYYTNAGQRF